MTEALQRLRKVLALERSRKFADTSVIGGLDAYLQHFLSETPLPAGHRFQQVLRALPPRGYRALHPVQRRRVVEELEVALAESNGPVSSPSGSPKRPTKQQPPSNRRDARPRGRVTGTPDSPVDALKEAARILVTHLRLIAGLALEEEAELAE